MKHTDPQAAGDDLLAIAVGGIAALLLGMGLTLLRAHLPAACFGYGFMALTIVVAEWGGSRAALVTALTSALSLDFFLTEPYLHLSISKKEDLVTFVGLGVCGVIVALFRARREREIATLRASSSRR